MEETRAAARAAKADLDDYSAFEAATSSDRRRAYSTWQHANVVAQPLAVSRSKDYLRASTMVVHAPPPQTDPVVKDSVRLSSVSDQESSIERTAAALLVLRILGPARVNPDRNRDTPLRYVARSMPAKRIILPIGDSVASSSEMANVVYRLDDVLFGGRASHGMTRSMVPA